MYGPSSPDVSLNFVSGKHQDSQENKTNCFRRDHLLSVYYFILCEMIWRAKIWSQNSIVHVVSCGFSRGANIKQIPQGCSYFYRNGFQIVLLQDCGDQRVLFNFTLSKCRVMVIYLGHVSELKKHRNIAGTQIS